MAMDENAENLGPYRLLERLGRGGMGEVFLAHDPRLDRRVAIKRIRPDTLADERRARFRREARLAARLRHPGIVQIHDVLTVGDAEHLVLEYVPGASLKRQLDGGPLPVDRGLALTRQIAAALAHAHRHGVIHRDLKAENVLVTPEGEAKIVDFGIGKEISGSGDTSVTREGGVAGTPRAMSPEQIRGETIGPASDLFSFGILLYETLTGRSPFIAASAVETLDRVLHHRPEPVSSLAPEVPPELSELVDHLLEKESALRPRSAAEVERCLADLLDGAADDDDSLTRLPEALPTVSANASVRSRRLAPAVAVLLVLVIVAGIWALRPVPPPRVIAVMPPEVRGETEADLERLAFAVRGALLRSLVSLRGVAPVSPTEIDAVEGTPEERARAVAADEAVLASLVCRNHGCDVELRRVPTYGGGITWSRSFEVPVEDLAVAARAVEVQLRQGFSSRSVRPGWKVAEVSGAEYAAFLEAYRIFTEARETMPLIELEERLTQLRKESGAFLDAVLLEADVARYRYQESGDPEALEKALDLVRQARTLAPVDPTATLQEVKTLLAGRRLDEAEAALETLEEQIPGDARVLDHRARLLEMRGEVDRALEILERAAERQPSWRRLYNLAWMSLRHSRTAAARTHLEHLLERAPGKYEGLSLLAQLELASGDPSRAIELYAELVERSPGPVELSNLGLAHTLVGEYGAAAEASRRAYELAPESPIYALNLADARWLEGRLEESRQLYVRVLELLAADPNPPGWQQLTVAAQARAHLGEPRAAVADVQEALRQAPENAQVAFEAALVYAVVGDRTAALVNVERAVDLGLEPRWFELPWFDRLEAEPGFVRLVEARD